MSEAAHMEVSGVRVVLICMVDESHDNEIENSLAHLVYTPPVSKVVSNPMR